MNEVSDIYDGTHQTPKYQDDGVMFLSVENIKTLTSNKFISREAFEDEFKIRPQRGDVLMTRIGDIGTANVVETDEDLAYYVSLALFKSEELNPYFLQASIYAPFVQDQIWKRTLHIAFPKKINKNAIGQVPINVPTLAEQTKIGSFFKQLDRHITLHQRKLDKLKSVKQAYLSEMFPAEGERVPKRRFPGFTDAWELRKLGEVADIIGGGTPSTSNSEFWDGDIDWYTPAEIGEQIYVDGSERKITQLGLDKSSATLLPANKTILFTSRAGIGKTAILRSDATTNQGFQSIVVDNNTEPYFIFSMTDKIKNKAISVASGSTFAEISSRALGQLEFMFPSINEQEAIGTFFSTLDSQITLHQRKLEKLKNLKKALLNELFV